MRKILLVLLLFVSFHSNAQLNSAISFSPFTLFANPIVRFGYEVEFKPKAYLQAEIGYGRDVKGILSNSSDAPFSKFQFRTVLKYKFSEPNAKILYYLFFDDFLNAYTLHYNVKRTFYYSDISDMTYDKVDVNIKKLGFNIGNGFEVKLIQRFYVDFYFGLGIAKRSVVYKNGVNPILHYRNSITSGLSQYEEPISRNVLSVKSGINIVYKLGIIHSNK